MRFSEDIGFAIIHRNKTISDNLKNIFLNANKLNKKYFSTNPEKFSIFVCDTEEVYKKYAQPYYSKWSTAVGLGMKGITTRSPEFSEELNHWKKKDFQSIMNHEVSHVFWYHTCKTWNPQWLVEGLACYIGNNFLLSRNELKEMCKKYKVNYDILDFRYMKRNFSQGHFPRYPVWRAFTEFIIKEYSMQKIKDFIEKFSQAPNKKNYQKSFKQIFQKTDRDLFRKFLSELL